MIVSLLQAVIGRLMDTLLIVHGEPIHTYLNYQNLIAYMF